MSTFSTSKEDHYMESLVYVGMDVHKDTYSLCCYTPGDGCFFAEATVDADARLIKKYLGEVGKTRPGSKFSTCYEAGCLGFSLYKELTKLGIDCKIVAPTTLAKEPGSAARKTDRKDARMLARNLAFGLCKFVHIPDEIDLETREFVRMRSAHKKALKKVKQQILAFCLRLGKKYGEGGRGKQCWTAAHLDWLKKLELSAAMREILDEYLDTYDKYDSKIERLDGRLLERSDEERYKGPTDRLNCLKGVTKQGALTIVSEIGDFSRFATANEFCSYIGMVPGQSSSGQSVNYLGITKQGNSIVRWQLVESAQSIVRGTPGKKSKRTLAKQSGMPARVVSYCDRATERMMRKFNRLVLSGKERNKAVTAVARELACFIWGLMTDNLDGRRASAAK